MPSTPRVRFSPSPTGMFHVGGARTALFNWLYARQQGGTFLLRIEDTDAVRNRPEWTEGIYAAMTWLGLDWDETYAQSRNLAAHTETGRRLHAEGKAYYCECTPEAAQARNKANGIKTPGYDGHCRDLELASGDGRALRFRTPDEGTITRVDLIRGTAGDRRVDGRGLRHPAGQRRPVVRVRQLSRRSRRRDHPRDSR